MKTTLFTIISLLLILAGCHTDKQNNYPSEAIMQSGQSFTFHLYKEVVKAETGNICLSPFSVSFCLGLIMNGTEGKTYEEIRQTMGFQHFSREDINLYMQAIHNELSKADTSITFMNANSIWIKDQFDVSKTFIRTNIKYFQAETYNEPFDATTVQKINLWSAAHTNGKIKKPVQSLDDQSRSILINAIYFQGTWTDEFDKSKTADEPFRLADSSWINVPTMSRKGYIASYRDKHVTLVELPYGNKIFSMVLFLPTPEEGNINEIIANLNEKQWQQWLNNLSDNRFELHLPCFNIEQKVDLEKQLKALGIKKAFNASSDFAPINNTGKFLISSITQNTFIEVNEEGTEAAATTVAIIIAEEEYYSDFPSVVRFDRPFGYMIKENSTGAILFAGKVAKPQR